MSEKFCLKWNDFETNVSKSFGLLRNEEYLHDVTLVCDDNNQVAAHKLVLSACSDFFKTVFQNNKHQNPLICLEGISSKELQDVLDYMYIGETNIFQEGLDRFLSVAQRFKIMGLIQNEENNDESDEPQYQANQEDSSNPGARKAEVMNESFEFKEKGNYIPENPIQRPIQRSTSTNRAISLNIDEVNNINQRTDELIETLPDGSVKCIQCGKVDRQAYQSRAIQHMRNHAETHLEGLSLECQLCGKQFRSRNSLNSHRSQLHKNKI